MIKSVTTRNIKDMRKNTREMSAEVTIEGNGQEIMYEFIGILDTLEKQCPVLLATALTLHMREDEKHDN